jgi:O-antigen ligase
MLAFLIMASALLFGAVEIWSSAAVLALVYTLGLVWVLRKGYAEYRAPAHTKLLIATGFVFTLYTCTQIVPLPFSMLKYLSPEALRLREFYALEPSGTGAISLVPYRSLMEVLKAVAFFTVFSIASIYFISRDRLKNFIIALSLFGFCLAVFSIVQKATWNGGIYWFRELSMGGEPFGPFVNRNHFAGFIGMIIPLTLGLAITKHSREKKIFYGFLAVIMSVALFFSLSRGGVVSFFSGMLLFGFLMVASRLQQKKVWVIGIFIVAVLTYLVWLGVDPIMERFSRTDITKEERLVVWSTTLTAAKDFWLTGSGLGTFLNIFPLYSPSSVQSIYDHAHNDYLEFLLETGLGGVLLFACFIGLLLRSVFRSTFEGSSGIMLMAALSSAMSMAVHSVFDFNLHILSNLLLFGTVLGMVAALSDVDDPHPPPERRKKPRSKGRGDETAEGMEQEATQNKPASLQAGKRESETAEGKEQGTAAGEEEWEKEIKKQGT